LAAVAAGALAGAAAEVLAADVTGNLASSVFPAINIFI